MQGALIRHSWPLHPSPLPYEENMMTPLNARAFEIPHALENAPDPAVQARRNRIFARWASEQLQLTSSASRAYIRSFGDEVAQPESEGAVLARVRADFAASAVMISQERMHAAMTAALIHAAQQVRAESCGRAA